VSNAEGSLVGDQQAVIEQGDLQALLDVLRGRGWRVIGPKIAEGAIVLDEVAAVVDLPVGWTDEQEGGRYRLKRRGDDAVFGYVVGPHSWKMFLHPPTEVVYRTEKQGNSFRVIRSPVQPEKMAFLGARPCDLQAISVLDAVLASGPFADAGYRARRENVFVVAVNCGQAARTCFCTSMGTGPKASHGYDLALTEILTSDRHCFLVDVGSEAGRTMLSEVPRRDATEEDRALADAAIARAEAQIVRQMQTDGIKELLYANYGHPRWDEVAKRCLACGNCTSVCPTCEDAGDLTGQHAERVRRWDSCFTADFSYIHGGTVRASIMSRYRQWMTHKLATWIDQFGMSGCVGCGRCITWCPVGIDITEEAAAIRASSDSSKEAVSGGT
jgi:sulfhydrogenase subunit beta (sulfur reductase)